MISCVMQTNKCAPRGNHVLNAQSLKRDGRASLHRRVPHQSHRRIPTTLTSGHKAPVLLRPCATRNRTVAHIAQCFYRPSSGQGPVESLTFDMRCAWRPCAEKRPLEVLGHTTTRYARHVWRCRGSGHPTDRARSSMAPFSFRTVSSTATLENCRTSPATSPVRTVSRLTVSVRSSPR